MSSPQELSAEAGPHSTGAMQLVGLGELQQAAASRLNELGDSAYGADAEDLHSFQQALESAGDFTQAGDMATAQRVLEQSNAPVDVSGEKRDALVDLHTAARGEISDAEREQAVEGLWADRLGGVDAMPEGTPTLGDLLNQYDAYYFDDTLMPEANQIMGKTPHEAGEKLYEELIEYAEAKIRDPNTDPTTLEQLRVARDTLHVRHKSLAELRAAQDETAAQMVALAGEGGVVRADDMIQRMRGYDTEGLARVRQVLESARDSQERASFMTQLQSGRLDVRTAEGFAGWQERRAARLQLVEGQKQANMLAEARQAIAANTAAAPVAPAVEQSQAPIPPVANETATVPRPEAVTRAAENTMLGILSRVPRTVIGEALSDIARARSRDGGTLIDVNTLGRAYEARIRSGSLGIDPTDLQTLMGQVSANGFASAGPNLWANRSSSSREGKIAANARAIVRDLLNRIV